MPTEQEIKQETARQILTGILPLLDNPLLEYESARVTALNVIMEQAFILTGNTELEQPASNLDELRLFINSLLSEGG